LRRIVAFASGKAGVGTSMLATNVAVFLAQIGKRVVLVDANFEGAGLGAWLGCPAPECHVGQVLFGGAASLDEIAIETPVSGLRLAGRSPQLFRGKALDEASLERFGQAILGLGADFVLMDLPGGPSRITLELGAIADALVVCAMPTPDAVACAYELMTALLLEKLHGACDAVPAARACLEQLGMRPGPYPTAREMCAALGEVDAMLGRRAAHIAASFHPLLIVNQLRVKTDETVGEAMVSAATRFLGLVPRSLGGVEWDDNVWQSLRRQRPLLVEFPQSRACRGLERVVRRLLGIDLKDLWAEVVAPPSTQEQNLYELLEIYPGASEEEVRRGLKRIRDLFGHGALAMSGVCSDTERETYQRMAQDAHATLVDKARRREYDRIAFPDGFPHALVGGGSIRTPGLAQRVTRPHETLPRVEVPGDQLVDGAFLGKERRQRGIELVDISNRARISVSYLEAIEEERFDDLPAAVYTRGFVTEFARFLKIDPGRAASDFMAKYEAGRKR
jgi:flagellar biosynthesis protein FlhG